MPEHTHNPHDDQARCAYGAETASYESLQTRALQALLYTHLEALEQDLRRGDVFALALPSDASACLFLDEWEHYCFVWEESFHGQAEEQNCFPFERLEQALLWIFTCIFSRQMTRQEAQRHYASWSQMGTILAKARASSDTLWQHDGSTHHTPEG